MEELGEVLNGRQALMWCMLLVLQLYMCGRSCRVVYGNCTARVRACNSVNFKLGGIIEPLLKIVNVLHMRPRLGIVHSDQPARHGYGGAHFYRIWWSQQKSFVRLRFCLQVVQAWKWKCPWLCSCTWPGVLILVQFNNFARTTGFYWSYMLLL